MYGFCISLELVGEFGGNKHATYRIAGHFAAVRYGGRRLYRRGFNANPGRTKKRPKIPKQRLEKKHEKYKFQNIQEQTTHKLSDGLSLRRDA